MGLMDSEETLRKGYKKAGVKTLRNALREMEFSDDDYEIDSLTKSEIIEIIENYMGFGAGYNKGGAVTKKSRGASDYRKGGMVLSTVDRRKKRG
jgi:hypothetical protein